MSGPSHITGPLRNALYMYVAPDKAIHTSLVVSLFLFFLAPLPGPSWWKSKKERNPKPAVLYWMMYCVMGHPGIDSQNMLAMTLPCIVMLICKNKHLNHLLFVPRLPAFL